MYDGGLRKNVLRGGVQEKVCGGGIPEKNMQRVGKKKKKKLAEGAAKIILEWVCKIFHFAHLRFSNGVHLSSLNKKAKSVLTKYLLRHYIC